MLPHEMKFDQVNFLVCFVTIELNFTIEEIGLKTKKVKSKQFDFTFFIGINSNPILR
jgi:hypothetical protein